MTDSYLLVMRPSPQIRLRQLADAARRDPEGRAARALKTALDAIEALRSGWEAELGGKRLGFSPAHFDLRDCAEIKLPLTREFRRDGTPLGPSHRIIYREYESLPDDSRPIRELTGFGARARGLVFAETAMDLGRRRGTAVSSLAGLDNVVPAIGPAKDPDRPIAPVRLPLPPDVAAALQSMRRDGHRPSHLGPGSAAAQVPPANARRPRSSRHSVPRDRP